MATNSGSTGRGNLDPSPRVESDEPLSDEQINRVLDEFKRLQDEAIARGESPTFGDTGNNVISDPASKL